MARSFSFAGVERRRPQRSETTIRPTLVQWTVGAFIAFVGAAVPGGFGRTSMAEPLDAPTLAEAACPRLDADAWCAVLRSAGMTPKLVVEAPTDWIVRVLQSR